MDYSDQYFLSNKFLARCTYAPVPSNVLPKIGVGVGTFGSYMEELADVKPDCLMRSSNDSSAIIGMVGMF